MSLPEKLRAIISLTRREYGVTLKKSNYIDFLGTSKKHHPQRDETASPSIEQRQSKVNAATCMKDTPHKKEAEETSRCCVCRKAKKKNRSKEVRRKEVRRKKEVTQTV
jgi:hypothetical protein